ncbi:hypothetical protein NC651_037611 [Populus alba x Populus x berolinensis]|nr:hypothetical protein NC651_037611 [Populus alba x Populus x berolinensis]
MEDWEDVQVPPLLSKEQPKNKWDDEDVDEDDVKESWEDEDEPAPVREQHTQLVMENGMIGIGFFDI